PASMPFGGLTIHPPAAVVVQDSFKVTNRFNGGQGGVRGETPHRLVTPTTTKEIPFGAKNQAPGLRRATGVFPAPRPPPNGLPNTGSAYGGLYANASNIGHYNHDEFSIIPEININLGLNVTRGLTAYLGYNFLYINQIARPGDQMNPIVNSATVPFSPNY